MRLRFSIISPSYNQAQFLPKNLESVQSQTYPHVEHIIVDPGSTDGSTQIARKATGIRLIAEPDRGQSDGISKGFARSQGDILTWLNSDDLYPSSDVLAKVAETFDAYPDIDVVYGNVDFVDEDGEFLRKGYVNPDADNLLETFPYQVGIVQPGLFMRRRVFEELGGPSEQFEYCMDYEYWVRIASAGFRWHFLDEKLAHHRWWQGMKTSSGRDRSLTEHFSVCAKYFGYIHHKWLDRYAEYLLTKEDGVVNHASELDEDSKDTFAKSVIERFITQEILIDLEGSFDPERMDTLDYIRAKNPDLKRYYWPDETSEIPNPPRQDTEAWQKRAWTIFDTQDAAGRELKSYYVPDNFERHFDADWLRDRLEHGAKKLTELKGTRKDTCVIVGNGPSLSKSDLSLLEHADVIISNFAILNDQLREFATIHTVTNDLVAKQGSVDFNKMTIPKVLPFWLANTITDTDETVFLEATVNPKFGGVLGGPVSWRSTVSYFNMQLAFILGYEKVILIGFDHNYVQPEGMKEGDVIAQEGDDENHFDPRYFKGKDWQAADTDNMEATYRIAKDAYQEAGREIINCTVGGKLEVFRRSDLATELGVTKPSRKPTPKPSKAGPELPRLLLIDHTLIGNGTASGELKEALFRDWPDNRLVQLTSAGTDKLSLNRAGKSKGRVFAGGDADRHVRALLDEFKPELILYRPVPDTLALHSAAMTAINQSGVASAIWIFDDWPTSFNARNAADTAQIRNDLPRLLSHASLCLAISDPMAGAFEARYGSQFKTIANGIDPDDWPTPSRAKGPEQPIRVRYAGSLAENMTLDTIILIAEAVETLAQQNIDISFEIKTMEIWAQKVRPKVAHLEHTSLLVKTLSRKDYRAWLSDADIVTIGYNFDKESVDYVGHSVANKLPECLASGAALFAVGPEDVATLKILDEIDCGVRVTTPAPPDVAAALKSLAASPEARLESARKAQEVAFSRFNLYDIREQFHAHLREAAKRTPMTYPEMQRRDCAHVDETEVIAHMMSGHVGADHVLIDVGAHVGSSAQYFHDLGWSIHCFEPDKKNRAQLTRQFKNASNVTIDPRAVSDTAARSVPFFSSQQSTGISALHGFHSSHKESAQVDVTTLTDVFIDRGTNAVDFLKIDVEGFDFSVLKGVPWNEVKPRVIECEYEDAKTLKLGHNWQDIARYLQDKGYTVYVSEWHPIIRYGIAHDWRRIVPYPGPNIPSNSWGNLIAFLNDPGLKAVQAAFDAKLKKRTPPTAESRTLSIAAALPSPSNNSPTQPSATPQATAAAPTPTPPPPVTRLGSARRFLGHAVRGLWRRRVWTVPALLVLIGLAALGLFAVDSNLGRVLFLSGAIVGTLGFAVLYLGLRVFQFVTGLSAETAALRGQVQRLKAKLEESDHDRKSLENTLNQVEGSIAAKLASAEQRQTQKLTTRAKEIIRDVQRRISVTQSSHETAIIEVKTKIDDLGTTQTQDISKLGDTLQSEIKSATEALERQKASMIARLDDQDAVLTARQGEQDTALSQAIAQMDARMSGHGSNFEQFQTRLRTEISQTNEAYDQKIANLEDLSVALDVVSTLRSLRSLWLDGKETDRLARELHIEHGHALMMAVLAEEERQMPGSLAGKTLVEIGSTRELMPPQKSTQKFAIFSALTDMNFVTVDMDGNNTKAIKRILHLLNPAAQAITQKGEEYLALHIGPLDYVYLDAFDYYHDFHSDARKERYMRVLGETITDKSCWVMHKTCAEKIAVKMRVGGIVVLDDTWLDADDKYTGKGKTALPYLLENGFEIIATVDRSIALKRKTGGPAETGQTRRRQLPPASQSDDTSET